MRQQTGPPHTKTDAKAFRFLPLSPPGHPENLCKTDEMLHERYITSLEPRPAIKPCLSFHPLCRRLNRAGAGEDEFVTSKTGYAGNNVMRVGFRAPGLVYYESDYTEGLALMVKRFPPPFRALFWAIKKLNFDKKLSMKVRFGSVLVRARKTNMCLCACVARRDGFHFFACVLVCVCVCVCV